MAKFIEITDSYNTKVSINVNHIISFENDKEGGCDLVLSSFFDGKSNIKTSINSYEDIKLLING